MADEISRVFIIERNIAWREAIAALLNRQPDMEVIGTSADISEASRGYYQHKPDVILIDSLPSSEADCVIFDHLKHTFANAHFVLHTSLRQEAIIEDLSEVDVTEYLFKGSSPTKILQVIREVCQSHLEKPDAIYILAE